MFCARKLFVISLTQLAPHLDKCIIVVYIDKLDIHTHLCSYIKKTTGNVDGSNPLPLLGGLGFVAFILVATHPFLWTGNFL